MDDTTHILHLEDDEIHARLVLATIQAAGINCRIRRVQTEVEFCRELREGSYDIILTDFSLPSFDGMSALRLAGEYRPDIPFIFVSGKMGEDAAIEALTEGATDYVLKQKLTRLVPAIKRALLEAENRQKRLRFETELRESEERFRALAESANDGIITTDIKGAIVYWNRAAREMFGYSDEEISGKPIPFLMPESHREQYRDEMSRWRMPLERGHVHHIVEALGRKKNGSEFPIELSFGSWETGQGLFLTGMIRDITERKNSEERLRLQSVALEAAANGIVITNREGTIIWVNPAFTGLTGYTEMEAVGQNPRVLKSGKHDLTFYQNLWNTIMSGQIWQGELVNRRKDGSLYTEEMTISPVRTVQGKITHFIAIKQDITGRKAAEQMLRKMLDEKETLMLELHHRTNNNMGLITALLNLQASEVKDERLRAAFTETKNRIHSMALVHQVLYDSHDLSRINLKEYIHRLVKSLAASYQVLPEKSSISLNTEDLLVLFDTAIPCGLILNELITNSLLYAFPGDRTGTIRIELAGNENGDISLLVADDGVGVPSGFDFRTDGHLGFRHIFILGEQQLNGQVRFEAERGVTCRITFRDDLYSPRV